MAAAVVSAAGLAFGLKTAAVNTLIGFGSGGYYISFFLVCSAALVARLSGRWRPAGLFSLGRYGTLVNAVACAWLLFEAINIAWPRAVMAPPGAPFYQVWAVVVVSAVLLVVGIAYVLMTRPQDRIRASTAFADLSSAGEPTSGR
jgi:amino acid transporter